MHSLNELLPIFSQKTVLVRVDFNVPIQNGRITDPTRIQASKSTIDLLCQAGARVVLLSHFKDPKEEDLADPERKAAFSFAPIISALEQELGRPVELHDLNESNLAASIQSMDKNSVFLLENSRFWAGEKKGDPALSAQIAELGDFFINDAFSCAHRTHASVIGIARLLPTFPGLHLAKELSALHKAFLTPQRPVVGIVGGAKVSSKFPVLANLLPKVDFLAIGGAMVHTFFVHQGLSIGKSLYEPEYVEQAGALLKRYREKVLFPCDVLAAPSLDAQPVVVGVSSGVAGIPDGMAAYDIGPATVLSWSPVLRQAKTIVWNGTLGVAEHPPFDEGSRKVAQIICDHTDAFSLAGGGDTLAALKSLGFADRFSHVCTGGGAFLEWLAHGSLPAEETFTSQL